MKSILTLFTLIHIPSFICEQNHCTMLNKIYIIKQKCKNRVGKLAFEKIERRKNSDLNKTEHPVLMVWFENSAHLKHLNPSFKGLLYLCEQSGGVYSLLIQDFHLHWGIISVKHTSAHRYSFQMHPRPPLWRDALSVTLECANYGFTRPASEARDRRKKMGVGESMSRSIVFCFTFLRSVTIAGVWVISSSLWEICSALYAAGIVPRFKLLISC